MSLSSVKNKLRKLEERAEDRQKLILLPMSDLERANRIRYLLERGPNEGVAERIGELIRIALCRQGESS